MSDEPVRVGCTLMVVRGGKVLLGKRGQDCETAKGQYAYPGGRMDYGETPEQGAVRELFEETGMVVTEKDIQFLRYANEFFPEAGKHYVSLVFMVENPQGEPIRKEPDKCEEWIWVAPNELPENTFGPAKDTIMMFIHKIVGLL